MAPMPSLEALSAKKHTPASLRPAQIEGGLAILQRGIAATAEPRGGTWSRQSRGCSRGASAGNTAAITSEMARQALRAENESARGAQLWAANSKPKAKRRVTDLVSDLRVGAAVQQQRHGLHFATVGSPDEGRVAVLQRANTHTSNDNTPQCRPRLHNQPNPPPAPHMPPTRCSPERAPGPATRAAGRPCPAQQLATSRPQTTPTRRHASGAVDGLTLSLASRSALRSSSTVITSTLPLRAATMRAVSPSCSGHHAFQPRQHTSMSATAKQSTEALSHPAPAPNTLLPGALPASPPEQQADHARHCRWPHRDFE